MLIQILVRIREEPLFIRNRVQAFVGRGDMAASARRRAIGGDPLVTGPTKSYQLPTGVPRRAGGQHPSNTGDLTVYDLV